MPQYKIKSDQIAEMRAYHRQAVVAEMIQFKTKINKRFVKFDFAAAIQNK